MMDQQPLVSVIMTAYNREQYIAAAIESVLASSYANLELMIVDDHSTDQTVTIAQQFSNDPRVVIHVNETNLGQFPNRNHAAGFANGKYIIYVDSDDMILEHGIKDLVEAMEANPTCGIAMFAPQETSLTVLPPEVAIRDHFFKQPFLNHGPGGTMLRNDFFTRIGRYPVDYGIPGDMYFNLKAGSQSPVLLIPFPFMYYRRHEGQEINNKYDYLYNNYKYMKDALVLLPLPLTEEQKLWLAKKNKRRFTVNIVKYFFRSFNLSKTKAAIKKSGFTFKDALQGIFH